MVDDQDSKAFESRENWAGLVPDSARPGHEHCRVPSRTISARSLSLSSLARVFDSDNGSIHIAPPTNGARANGPILPGPLHCSNDDQCPACSSNGPLQSRVDFEPCPLGVGCTIRSRLRV